MSKEVTDEDIRIPLKFGNLDNETLLFVKQFYSENGYYPLFHILEFYLVSSDIREYVMYRKAFGFEDCSKSYTLSEIAADFSLSRERVRQILSKIDIIEMCTIKRDDWLQYFETAPAFITSESEFFTSISFKEKCRLSFSAFCDLATHTGLYSYIEDFNVLCLKDISSDITYAYSTLVNYQSTKRAEETILASYDILKKSVCENTIVMNIIFREVAPSLNIDVRGQSFYFSQNHIDIIKEVYDYLYSLGEPTHIDNIFAFLTEKYPSLHLSVIYLKSKIRNSQEIIPIGKTSMYKLSHWRHFFSGNIRDLLRKILGESDVPLHIDTITDRVTDNFDTNKKSIHSSLLGCDDFQTFEGGLFGLSNKIYPPEYRIIDLSKTRSSFEDRFADFKKFVAEFQRLPYASGIDEEESLKRWHANVSKRILEVDDSQVEALENFIRDNRHLPCNGIEVKFYRTCSQYLDFVNNNYELPTRTTDSSLYYWFLKNRTLYSDYTDNRKRFFQDLIDELSGYGFI